MGKSNAKSPSASSVWAQGAKGRLKRNTGNESSMAAANDDRLATATATATDSSEQRNTFAPSQVLTMQNINVREGKTWAAV